MQLIGLTGGIASGKSVVAKRLAELGAVHVDADAIAREVVEPGTPGLASIRAAFGDGVITPDGSLDRAALGAIVFTDPQKRAVLNGITHPAVWKRSRELFAAAEAADPNAIVIYDVPLLVEGSDSRPMTFDLIVVVHASMATRISRMVELRGMSRDEALHRLNSQASDTERLAVADVVIDNDGDLENTLAEVDALWQMLANRAG
ncbi:MAG: dephospho-CoA kinase [Actinomycetota bacterium]|nr:dephospho-CoA kinase [Actinomycetota bacterium]